MSERPKARPRTGLRPGDIARLVVTWLVSSAALALAAALLPNLAAQAWWAYFAAAAVAGLLGLVFRPVLVLGHLPHRLARGRLCRSGRAGAAGLRRDLDRAGDQCHVPVGVLGVVDRRRGCPVPPPPGWELPARMTRSLPRFFGAESEGAGSPIPRSTASYSSS